MKKIDFDKTTPDYVHENLKWYIVKEFQEYIQNKQADNLPVLTGIGCFVVKGIAPNGDIVEDFVLIDDKQNVICNYPHTFEGIEQMHARINIMKIDKAFNTI